MTTKKVIGSLTLILLLIAAYGFYRAQKLSNTFSQIRASFKWADNFKFSFTKVSFSMDVKLSNPTEDDFSFDGNNLATLSEISIVLDGKKIATVNTNITVVEIPELNSIVIENLPVEIPLENLAEYLSVMTMGQILEKSKIVCYVSILGTKILIKNE
ncbi:MAG TPA: hypothetical protein VK528_06155 [Flavobacterium sp.]|nr:hypothetical protein [Flavobacterium sp.]